MPKPLTAMLAAAGLLIAGGAYMALAPGKQSPAPDAQPAAAEPARQAAQQPQRKSVGEPGAAPAKGQMIKQYVGPLKKVERPKPAKKEGR